MKQFSVLVLAVLMTACGQQATDWAPVGEHIKTAWAEQINPQKVHQEYPRPQMVRNSYVNLNGLWDYAIGPKGGETMPGAQGQILVPFPLESSLSGVAGSLTADDALWYRREFKLPGKWRNKDVLLHFDAVDWACELWVNGQYAGSHQGGYTAFNFNISPYLDKSASQEIILKVLDATETGDIQPRGKQTFSPSRGKIWYTPVSGIWQTVWMEAVSKEGYIADYQLTSSVEEGSFTVSPKLCGEGQVKVELIEGGIGYNPEKPGSKVLASVIADGSPAVLKVPEPRLWSPDSPYLYGLRLTLLKDGKVIDQVNGYTSLREISIAGSEHRRLALNGEPLFQFGPLDQGWWPDGLYTAPCDEALRYDIERTKEYGFNMIRKHIKVEPSRWFYYCDMLGMLVWQDMPCVSNYKKRDDWAQGADVYDAGNSDQLSPQARENFISEWKDILDQTKKFQCIVVWVPFNEAWGQFDTKAVVDFTKAEDPTRPVNMASGGNWISGGVGDILDSHHYPHPQMRIWDPEMVNVLGEYGGIGLIVEDHTWETGKNWGYVELGTSEDATAKYEEYARMLIPLVREGCAAAVYTQTTDVERETNGLMTYDRKVDKLIPARVAAANRSVITCLTDQ